MRPRAPLAQVITAYALLCALTFPAGAVAQDLAAGRLRYTKASIHRCRVGVELAYDYFEAACDKDDERARRHVEELILQLNDCTVPELQIYLDLCDVVIPRRPEDDLTHGQTDKGSVLIAIPQRFPRLTDFDLLVKLCPASRIRAAGQTTGMADAAGLWPDSAGATAWPCYDTSSAIRSTSGTTTVSPTSAGPWTTVHLSGARFHPCPEWAATTRAERSRGSS